MVKGKVIQADIRSIPDLVDYEPYKLEINDSYAAIYARDNGDFVTKEQVENNAQFSDPLSSLEKLAALGVPIPERITTKVYKQAVFWEVTEDPNHPDCFQTRKTDTEFEQMQSHADGLNQWHKGSGFHFYVKGRAIVKEKVKDVIPLVNINRVLSLG